MGLVAPLLLATALFIGAIITQNFWLSLLLGLSGAAGLAYAALIVWRSRREISEPE
jgi:threonine/homoserine/homoserine lactone efflux protein